MSIKTIQAYEKPSIETIDAAELVELIGPAQGYGPEAGPGSVDSPLRAIDPTSPRNFGRL